MGNEVSSPFKVRASQIFSRGFIISQKIQNLRFRVLLFFKNRSILGTFWTPFLDPFLAFSPCKTAKIPPKMFARFARRVLLFLENFPKFPPGFIISQTFSKVSARGKMEGGFNNNSMVVTRESEVRSNW